VATGSCLGAVAPVWLAALPPYEKHSELIVGECHFNQDSV